MDYFGKRLNVSFVKKTIRWFNENCNRKFWKKYIIFISALFFIAFAIFIFLECKLGSDSLTVFLEGIHVKLNIAYSIASGLYNAVIVLFALVFARKYVGIGSLLYTFHIVPILAILEKLFPLLRIPDRSVYIRIFILVVGQILLSFGIALIICAKFGMNSLDAILHRIEDLTGFSYGKLRTIIDIIFVSIGFIWGGIIGIGTIFSVISTGIMIVWFKKMLIQPLERFYVT